MAPNLAGFNVKLFASAGDAKQAGGFDSMGSALLGKSKKH